MKGFKYRAQNFAPLPVVIVRIAKWPFSFYWIVAVNSKTILIANRAQIFQPSIHRKNTGIQLSIPF